MSYLRLIELTWSISGIILIGTLIFSTILLVQVASLNREIPGILPEFSPEHPENGSKMLYVRGVNQRMLDKIHDVHKNVIDKFFEQLKTFSNTWLAISGGIASSMFAQILTSGSFEFYLNLIILTCGAFIWSIAQTSYRVLNYNLMKKTKDLALWLVMSSPRI
jgi:hypothetical protein